MDSPECHIVGEHRLAPGVQGCGDLEGIGERQIVSCSQLRTSPGDRIVQRDEGHAPATDDQFTESLSRKGVRVK